MHDARLLEAARRTLLPRLAAEHRASPTAGTAMELARCAWRCGEYDVALDAFARAAALAPDDVECAVALARAASMLDRPGLEQQAVQRAVERGLDSAPLALQRALHCVPGDLARARALLAGHPGDAACAEFANALDAIQSGHRLPSGDHPAADARARSFNWVSDHAPGHHVHVGAPIAVLRAALAAMPGEGLVLECGVYFGRSLRVIASRVVGPVHGFDSFEGLPGDWSDAERAGAYSTAGHLPPMPPHVHLHRGWFRDTLPTFLAGNRGPIRLLHIDCDLYSSTQDVLQATGDRLVPGSVVVFDDMLGYPGFEAHELRAWTEFVASVGLRWELLAASLLQREVAVRIVA